MKITLSQAEIIYNLLRAKDYKTESETELFYEICDKFNFDYI